MQLAQGQRHLDVWFDSGSSWAGRAWEAWTLPGDRRRLLAAPVPRALTRAPHSRIVYLEVPTRHRGWFQSSLLTSVAVNGQAALQNGVLTPWLNPRLRRSQD